MSTAVARNNLKIYDAASEHWWSGRHRWVRALQKLVPARLRHFDRLVEWAGKDVLDVGCAGGFMAEAIATRGARVTGLDPATEAIRAARDHAQASDLSIRYDVGVGEALPYADGCFDIVVCVDVLEHVDDLRCVLGEIARVLRPGGTLLFDTINRNRLARFLTITMAEDWLRILPKGTHDPARFIRPTELRSELRRLGFRVGRLVGLGPRGIDRQGDPIFGI